MQHSHGNISGDVIDNFVRLAQLLEVRLDGVLGFYACHLEKGGGFGYNEHLLFPMASTCKIPIAAMVLTMVDQKTINLSTMVEISSDDIARTGEAAQSVIHDGVSLSVLNLLELMLVQSNNTATDRLLSLVHGPRIVHRWIQSIGIEGLHFNSSIEDQLNRFLDFPRGTKTNDEYLKRWPSPWDRERVDWTPNEAFEADPADQSTPAAMVELLVLLISKSVLRADSVSLLLEILGRCQTGNERLKGLMLPGAHVAHKTGSLGGTVNDVGLVDLPGSAGRVALAYLPRAAG